MKKQLLFLSLFSVLGLKAQTIATSDTLTVGDVMTYYAVNLTTSNFDSIQGANVVWDYSGLLMEPTGAQTTDEIINISASSYLSDFPTSQYHENFTGGLQTFFRNINNNVMVDGFVFNSAGSDYVIKYNTDPLKSLALPMVYEDTINDTLAGEAIAPLGGSNVTVPITGSAIVVVDGAGTLKLGTNSYLNTLRVKTFENTSGVYFGQNISISRKSYVYYSEATTNHFPLFIHGEVEITVPGGGVISQMTIWSIDDTQNYLAIDDAEENNLTFNIYPNPTDKMLTIQMDNSNKNGKIEIINAIGKVIYSSNKLKNNKQIDVSKLSSGIYFVRIEAENKILTKKLIIK